VQGGVLSVLATAAMARALGGERKRESRLTDDGGVEGWRCWRVGAVKGARSAVKPVTRKGKKTRGGGLLLLGVPNGSGGAVSPPPLHCSLFLLLLLHGAVPQHGGGSDGVC